MNREELNQAKQAAQFAPEFPADIPSVDVNALIEAGVSAGDAEDVAEDISELNRYLADMRGAFDELAEAASKGDAALLDTWGAVHKHMPVLEGLMLAGGLTVYDLFMEWDDESGSHEGYEMIETLWRGIEERDDVIRDFEEGIRAARDGN